MAHEKVNIFTDLGDVPDVLEAGKYLKVKDDGSGIEQVTAETLAGEEFTTTEKTKLAGIEDNATTDQTGAEIKTAYEAEANAYTNTKNTKLAGIEAGAEVNVGEEFSTAERTKLAGIATGAEVNPKDLAELDATASTKLGGIETNATADQTIAEIIGIVKANVKLNELQNPMGGVEFNKKQALQFAIENRTSDPTLPVTGQIWLRTDL